MSKTVAREGAGGREFLIYLLIYLNKLAYLQLITVLVYRSSPPKSNTRANTLKTQKITCE